ncbi:MAG TPA: hypothetical protein VFW73_09265, partial [Lacipirellulaceae bacterium]|nr:hypothetical protein [Lacipirellulaceae bacterium]
MPSAAKSGSKSIGGALWPLTAGQRARYSAAIAAMAAGTVFLLLVPYALKIALDALASGGATTQRTLFEAAAVIVVCHVLYGIFTYLRGRW